MTAITYPLEASPLATPLWRRGYVQVLVAAALGAVVGGLWPTIGVALKPLADAFISLIKLTITPLIFLVVCTGIAQVGDMRKVGRLGLKALLYFEAVTTMALLIGAVVGNLVDFGSQVKRPSADQAALTEKFAHSHAQSFTDLLQSIIPDNLFGAFVQDHVLQVLLIAILVGAALVRMGESGAPIRNALERASGLVFGVVNIVVLAAPIGAFA